MSFASQQPRPTPPAVQAGCLHAEAFNLMYYENEETGLGILVSNPRDKVSPFCCFLEGKEYRHTWWGLDRFLPGFKPLPGMYFFRDVTPEEATDYAEQRIAQFIGTEYEVAPDDHARVLASLKAQFVGTPKLDRTPKP